MQMAPDPEGTLEIGHSEPHLQSEPLVRKVIGFETHASLHRLVEGERNGEFPKTLT